MLMMPGTPGADEFNRRQDEAFRSGGIYSKASLSNMTPVTPTGLQPGQISPLGQQSQFAYIPLSPVLNPPNPNPGTPTAGAPTHYKTIADNWMNQPTAADEILGITRTPTATATSPATPNPIYPGLTPPVTGSANIPGWPDFGPAQGQLQNQINSLLNPNDAQANYDVSMHGAERAAATGTSGSPLASEYTGRLRQSDIERRTQLGASLLTQQQDLALRDKFQTGQLSLQQAELALRDKIQTGQLSVEQARLILDWYRTMYPQSGGGGYGGGGGRGTGGGGGYSSPPEYNPRTGPAFQPSGSTPLLSLPSGGGSYFAPPPITAPDNWADLSPQDQSAYAAQYRGNGANYAPNPWETQEGTWYDPSYMGSAPIDEFDNYYD